MNKLEYIPGDLVKIEYGEATGKIGFVTNTIGFKLIMMRYLRFLSLLRF